VKKKSRDLAIVLVSGGMDSLLTAAIANEKHSRLAFLHVNYGQNTERKELRCFHQIADHYKVPKTMRDVIDIRFLTQIGGSSLTDKKLKVKNFKGESNVIPTSYVPFRNTHIISMAVSWAEVIGATKIYIGAVHEDSSGYPDCRPSYYRAMNKLIREGTKAGATGKIIQVITPVINMSKDRIVKKACALGAPLHLTWSCYSNNDVACGVCDSCALRLRGFQRAGIEDPITYKTKPTYR
jgi:7-cyano-7-deazaguanine synthase